MKTEIEKLIEEASYVASEGIGGNYHEVDPEQLVKLTIQKCISIINNVQVTTENELGLMIACTEIEWFFNMHK